MYLLYMNEKRHTNASMLLTQCDRLTRQIKEREQNSERDTSHTANKCRRGLYSLELCIHRSFCPRPKLNLKL